MNPHMVLFLSSVPEGVVFSLDMQTLISIGIHLINLIVLALVLARFLYNPVRKFMLSRAGRIEAHLKRGEESMAQADELKLQYEQKIREIEHERDEMLDAAGKHVAEERLELLAEAKAEAEAIIKAAEAEAETEKVRIQEEMKRVIIDASFVMAEKLVAISVDNEVCDRLFAEVMTELEATSWTE